MVKLAFTEPTIPEHPQLTFVSSGPMGGDAGHGADAALKITFPNTGAVVELSNPEARFEDHDTQGEEISISVCGDWEIDGFEEALKAADELAVVANNTGCATQEDADKLRAKIAAYDEKRGERE